MWRLAGVLQVVFESVFFIVTVVILLNLLIAMMADTYTKISQNAEAEYQMHFARLVKEYYEATVFPVPLSIIEKCVNEVVSMKASKETSDQLYDGLHWGRHYTWPASTLPFQLELAMRKVSVKQEMDKAASKGRRGGRAGGAEGN